MKRSDQRILTTHVGSLIRPPEIIEVLKAEAYNQPYDEAAFKQALSRGVKDVVRKQQEAGVDVPSDGEFGKVGWMNYVIERFDGLEAKPIEPSAAVIGGRDGQDFAAFYSVWTQVERTWLPPHIRHDMEMTSPVRWVCTSPLSLKGTEAIRRDIANFKAALNGANFEEAFMPVAAPGSVEPALRNEYYKSDEEYIYALAAALREEYREIVDAGLLLQIDDAFMPALFDRYYAGNEASFDDFHKFSQMRIEALNHALEGIPEDRIRYHICWGSWNGPHSTDIPLAKIVDLVLMVKAQAYSIEAANPRHEHEWKVWENTKLPDGKVLIPGVVTHSTNIIEHPELVAQRLTNFARLIGRENVMAGTDCGFSQTWNLIRTHESVQWAKLRALADGAAIASKELWA